MIKLTKLKSRRLAKKLSISDVSEIVDKSKSYLYQLEKGCKSPSRKTMIKIAEALDSSVQELFFSDEN